MGLENLVLLTDETRKRVYDAARRPPDGFVLDKTDKEKDKEVTSPTIAAKGKRWGVGCTEFEALMRMLDNAVSNKINRSKRKITYHTPSLKD